MHEDEEMKQEKPPAVEDVPMVMAQPPVMKKPGFALDLSKAQR
jgi:hypothetical protein